MKFKFAQPRVPYTLTPARKGDVFMITVPNYWGKGETIKEARQKLREVTGKTIAEHGRWRVYSVHPTTFLNEMGYIDAPEDHPPMMLAEHDPKE
jgi:hypothetical protein